MNLISVKLFFCRSDVKIMIIGTATGGILQILSKRYLKNHPEFLKDSSESKETPPRGGAGEIVAGKVLVQAILSFLAQHGLTAGLISSTGVVIGKIPITAVSKYLRDAVPQTQNLPDKTGFILIDGEKVYLKQFDQKNLEYLHTILKDKEIPFEEKQKTAHSILTKYVNLKTGAGRRNFVLCIVLIISMLYALEDGHSSFYIMMRNLTKAIREGKISKRLGRLIVRKLRKKGVLIDPELVDIIA